MEFSANGKIEQHIGCQLVTWFGKNRRILPWRTHSSIYYRLVSEFMLQQTQVSTVTPYFERWIKQFPSITVLAEASETEVLKAWEGLGYYARAKNLHETAKIIIKQENFTFPKTLKEWQRLPGIGDYTAHALASIAQNQHVAAVDGNVIRVLCRINGIQKIFENKNQAVKYIKNIATLYIPHGKSAHYNEAVMEFGALICRAQNPFCDRCPITKYCHSFQEKLDCSRIPQFRKTIYIKKNLQRVFICNNSVILLKQTNTKRLYHIFELPLFEDISQIISMRKIAEINRAIVHERITEIILEPEYLPENLQNLANDYLILLPIQELKNITLSGPHRKWLDKKITAI
ncbi:MAG: A/G-specific adenine glycosylase [Puniceicoccales bacterium]|jgi:A/G-specific adenine glycosylase|nr:A/G-specific adenine glycosylase [Puniceicoccales bacterium]